VRVVMIVMIMVMPVGVLMVVVLIVVVGVRHGAYVSPRGLWINVAMWAQPPLGAVRPALPPAG
jgi:hypothetical protein